MSCKVSIQDLPDEMLEQILLLLGLEDHKSALHVCKRWSVLKPFDPSSVQLVVDIDRFYERDYQDDHRALLASSRRYKHVAVNIRCRFEHQDLLLEILSSFSRSVESLKLRFNSEPERSPTVGLMLFAKIAKLLPKLKHLEIYEGVFQSSRDGLEFFPMNDLEELYLKNDLLISIPNMQEMTPNITRLHLQIFSDEAFSFLRDVSSRLVELEIWYQSVAEILAVCTIQFPLLEKLTISCVDEELNEVVNVDRFFQQLPPLKGLILRCPLFDGAGNLGLPPTRENIQCLCLEMTSDLDANDIRVICSLKNLKHLRIGCATLELPTVFDFPRLKSLHVLTLNRADMDYDEFNLFCQYAFPSLAVFEVVQLLRTYSVLGLIKCCDNICSNMPFMKRLVLSHSDSSIQLGPLLKFCASRSEGLRELRIKCHGVLGDFPLDEPPHSITVQTLMLDVQAISLTTLHHLIQSMGKLKRLELPQHTFRTMGPEASRSLRVAFPRCEIVARKSNQIEEPL